MNLLVEFWKGMIELNFERRSESSRYPPNSESHQMLSTREDMSHNHERRASHRHKWRQILGRRRVRENSDPAIFDFYLSGPCASLAEKSDK